MTGRVWVPIQAWIAHLEDPDENPLKIAEIANEVDIDYTGASIVITPSDPTRGFRHLPLLFEKLFLVHNPVRNLAQLFGSNGLSEVDVVQKYRSDLTWLKEHNCLEHITFRYDLRFGGRDERILLDQIYDDPSDTVQEHAIKRLSALQLRRILGAEAYPLLHKAIGDPSDKKATAVSLAIKRFPIPNPAVPWEKIVDFRQDPDRRLARLALKNFISDLSCGSLSIGEMQDRMDHTLELYETHAKLHKLKVNRSKLEIVIATAAELIENVLTLRLSDAVKKIFDLKRIKVELLEGELSNPGSAVAYIAMARNQVEK